jgi:putative transposase
MKLLYKYRIYPSQSQREFLNVQFGQNRFVWNYFVALVRDYGYMTYNEMAHYLVHVLKHEHPWLQESVGQSLQQTLMDLSKSYRKHLKAKKLFNPPNFKKKRWKQSARFPQYTTVDRINQTLKIQKLDSPIRIILHRDLPEYTMCTIIKDSDDRYYASFIVEKESVDHVYNNDIEHVGIDLGLTDLLTLSDGTITKPPKFFRKSEDNLARKNRALSKKTRGSKRWLKSKKRLTRVHSKIKRQRLDFTHKLTTQLANDHDAISVECLSIQQMSKNHKLSKSIMDASWGMIYLMLEYKLKFRGKSFIDCQSKFASTQICSSCDIQTGPKGLGNLGIRNWTCSSCGTTHDRDVNAAINISKQGDLIYKMKHAA